MDCFCCGTEVTTTYHVKIREYEEVDPEVAERLGPDSVWYMGYRERMVYRSAFVCPDCYEALDSETGVGIVGGRTYGINGRSRHGRAAAYDEAKYRRFRRRKAAEIGVDID